MKRKAKVSAGLPSAAKAARILGVSKKVAEDLSTLAEHSWRTGEYAIPGFGRLVRVKSLACVRPAAAGGNSKKTLAKREPRVRFVKFIKAG